MFSDLLFPVDEMLLDFFSWSFPGSDRGISKEVGYATRWVGIYASVHFWFLFYLFWNFTIFRLAQTKRPDHRLTTTGVYALVRHPGYSGTVEATILPKYHLPKNVQDGSFGAFRPNWYSAIPFASSHTPTWAGCFSRLVTFCQQMVSFDKKYFFGKIVLFNSEETIF